MTTCLGCDTQNRDDALHCRHCDAELGRPCPACSSPTACSDAFCRRCGLALGDPGDATPAAPTWTELKGERRLLTVMFCDLVGSTPMSERLDPEDLRRVLGAYQDTCARIIARYEGHVAQYRGDGLLVYFSYPHAHEDDAERAVRAGLDIVAAVGDLSPDLARRAAAELHVRVGIHTGRVLLGQVGAQDRREAVALGHTVNVAARLQEVGRPDSVLASGETLDLVRGLFETEQRVSFELKGIAGPVIAARVLRPTSARTRLEDASAEASTPLLGRAAEIGAAMRAWDDARSHRGRILLVAGEAGIGKSRLLAAVREKLGVEMHTWLACTASPHHRRSTFHPIRGLLLEGLSLFGGEAGRESAEALEGAVDAAGIDRDEAVPLLAELLSIPVPDRYRLPPLSAEARRARTLEAILAWIAGLARRRPLVVAFEDLHWMDASTLELLAELCRRVAPSRILLLLTTRPAFAASWLEDDAIERIVLGPLGREPAAALLERVAGDRRLPDRIVDEVLARSDGIPLFIEELTKNQLEGGAGAGGVPASLESSLMARLDRLGRVKEIAQLAAVIGREFSTAQLRAISLPELLPVDAALEQLARVGIVSERGDPRHGAWVFKHALIQDAAYHSLRKELRREWHARVVQAFERSFPELVRREPETLARHSEAGGLVEKAIGYYRSAGELAAERSAMVEAVGHLGTALELVRDLPVGEARDARELATLIALGSAICTADGWGADRAEGTYERARELSEHLGDAPELFPAVRGLIAFYNSRAQLDEALELSRRLYRLAKAKGRSEDLLLAEHHMGVIHFERGDFADAIPYHEAAIARYEPSRHAALVAVYQADPGVFARAYGCLTLSLAGAPERALAWSREAIETARRIQHPFSLTYALVYAGIMHAMRREWRGAFECGTEGAAIAREQHFGALKIGGLIARALSRVYLGTTEEDWEAGFAAFREAMAEASVGAGTQVQTPLILGQLAAALVRGRRFDEALAAVAAGLAFSTQTGARFWDAELHRVRGEVHAATGAAVAATESFREAFEIARRQRAGLLELRAASSWCRLCNSGREQREALRRLDEVYGRLAAAGPCPDVDDARRLLAG